MGWSGKHWMNGLKNGKLQNSHAHYSTMTLLRVSIIPLLHYHTMPCVREPTSPLFHAHVYTTGEGICLDKRNVQKKAIKIQRTGQNRKQPHPYQPVEKHDGG